MKRPVKWISYLTGAAAMLYLLAGFLPPQVSSGFDVNGFGRLPVLHGGRIKPIDTLARTSLLMLSGKQSVRMDGSSVTALEWLAVLMFEPRQAGLYPVFEIDDPDVLGALGIQQTTRRFPFAVIEPQTAEIERLSAPAAAVKPEQRSRFQTAIVNLQARVTLYQKLQNTLNVADSENVVNALRRFEAHLKSALRDPLGNPAKASQLLAPVAQEVERYRFQDGVAEFYPVPLYRNAGSERRWVSIGRAAVMRLQLDTYPPAVLAYAEMSDTWRAQDRLGFNRALQNYQRELSDRVPRQVLKTRFEFFFNHFAPFYRSLVIYLAVFLLIFASWIAWPSLNRPAFYLLLLAFTVHTFGLLSRMLLQGRPPVTNLYSSAIFVGWVSVLLGIVLERFYRNGIGSMVASLIGFLTLIVAHHLASTGDTLEMMRAVLDSNFWLATHVTSITIGYGSTFLSGFLATISIFRRRFDQHWNLELARTFERMVYGVVCFSTFFSFTGTILGGIWADQSWGRFWGWDPKENGALMIVLWNVFILHAKWGGYAEGINLMLLAVVGNIITALSWFGVNMLGIGLHSYGFMDKAFLWLLLFVASQLLIISFGLLRRPNQQT